jgi:hypothetical protein
MKKHHTVHHFLIAGLFFLVMAVYFYSLQNDGPLHDNIIVKTADGSYVQRSILGGPGEVAVTLRVSIGSGEHTYYAVEETVPSGWSVLDAGKGAVSGDTIRWLVINDTAQAPSTAYRYVVRAPDTGLGEFRGIYWIEGMEGPATISGQSTYRAR